ncbi:uncharacterized protein LOC144988785 [Oryzias latipes]
MKTDSWSWLAYFSMCVSIVVLLISLTLITVLCYRSWGGLQTCIHAKRKQGMSNQMIPILPKMSSPPGLHSSFSLLYDAHCSNSARATTVSFSPTENQPAAANSDGKTRVSDTVIYSVITIRGSGKPVAASQVERTEYAAIKVTNFQESS